MALFTLSATMSVLVMLSKTPLMMALLIVLQTTMVALSIYMSLSTSWLSFILFMIFSSAMMVIFVYASSLASNDFIIFTRSMVMSYVWSVPLLFLAAYFMLNQQDNHVKSVSGLSDMDLGPIMPYKLYTFNTSPLTMFLITYLLVALIVVAKISMPTKGALRAI